MNKRTYAHLSDPLVETFQSVKQPFLNRVFYAPGVLLDANDFKDEQLYHRGRLARALAYLHGSGTVAGLKLIWQPSTSSQIRLAEAPSPGDRGTNISSDPSQIPGEINSDSENPLEPETTSTEMRSDTDQINQSDSVTDDVPVEFQAAVDLPNDEAIFDAFESMCQGVTKPETYEPDVLTLEAKPVNASSSPSEDWTADDWSIFGMFKSMCRGETQPEEYYSGSNMPEPLQQKPLQPPQTDSTKFDHTILNAFESMCRGETQPEDHDPDLTEIWPRQKGQATSPSEKGERAQSRETIEPTSRGIFDAFDLMCRGETQPEIYLLDDSPPVDQTNKSGPEVPPNPTPDDRVTHYGQGQDPESGGPYPESESQPEEPYSKSEPQSEEPSLKPDSELEESSSEPRPDQEEELIIQSGLAIDYLGRMIEVSRSVCLRLQRWYDQQSDADLQQGFHPAAATGIASNMAGVVVDVFLRFVPNTQGNRPAFGSGPFEERDVMPPARLQDGYELNLIIRKELDPPLPQSPWPDLSAIADLDRRRQTLHQAILDAWREDPQETLTPAPFPNEHAEKEDETAVFLARIVIPATVQGDERPKRLLDVEVVVDNTPRSFVYASGALARWVGIH